MGLPSFQNDAIDELFMESRVWILADIELGNPHSKVREFPSIPGTD